MVGFLSIRGGLGRVVLCQYNGATIGPLVLSSAGLLEHDKEHKGTTGVSIYAAET